MLDQQPSSLWAAEMQKLFREAIHLNYRKITGGFRSDWGAKAYTDLLSVIATSKIKGQRVFETLVNLMGHPVLQFLGKAIASQQFAIRVPIAEA